LIILISLSACRVEINMPPEEASPAEANPERGPEAAAIVTAPEAATATVPGPTFTPSPAPQPTATSTLVPTLTATTSPTAVPTTTPQPNPLVKLSESSPHNINVRAGPGTAYALVGHFAPGQQAIVTGRNEDGSWWQIQLLSTGNSAAVGWIFANLVSFTGNKFSVPLAEAPPLPATATTEDVAESQEPPPTTGGSDTTTNDTPPTAEELAAQLDCGKDFCVTYQAMVPIWENGGCVGNHSIYITVLEGLPPGKPMDGVVIGDTFNNVEVASGSHGPGHTEITLWNNSMILRAKRHINGRPFTSEESFNFTSADELIPAEVLAANGYCEGRVDICEQARNNNQVCRGHYSWRVTFHKFR
jgi:uncharacterized protein YraI